MSTYRYRLSNYRDLMSKYRKFFDTVKSFFYGTNCWDFDSRHEMCVFFTLNRCFYPSTSSTTSARTDSSILERYELFVHNTTPQRYYIVTFQVRSKRSRQISAMFILLDMTGTAYTFYKNRENKKKRRKGKQIRKNRRGEKNAVPPRRGDAADTWKKTCLSQTLSALAYSCPSGFSPVLSSLVYLVYAT